MTTSADTITVTTTAQAIGAASGGNANLPKSYAIKAPSTNTNDVLLGGSGVDGTDHYPLSPGEAIGIDLTTGSADEDLYAVVASGTETLHVLSS